MLDSAVRHVLEAMVPVGDRSRVRVRLAAGSGLLLRDHPVTLSVCAGSRPMWACLENAPRAARAISPYRFLTRVGENAIRT